MPKKITLKDVAEHAGVSVTTVSNVVRDWPYISDETRQKVQTSIRVLGYSPNLIAQGLRTGRSQIIAFIIPELTDPHFASMVSIAEAAAEENGYNILILSTHENTSREAQFISYVQNGGVDGLLMVPVLQEPRYTHRLLRDMAIPVVMIDRIPNDTDMAYCKFDNFLAMQLAIGHLYDLGHTRIAHLGGPAVILSALERIDAYRYIIDELRLGYQVVTSNRGSWGYAEGYRAMKEILEQESHPTAVVAFNDLMAIGASHAIIEHNLTIPGDISLVGVDDLELCQYLNPPLTTIRQPVASLAKLSIEILVSLIQENEPENTQVSLDPELVIRNSTASLS